MSRHRRLMLLAALSLATAAIPSDESDDLFREIKIEPEAPDFREVIDFRLERRERQAPRPRDLYRQPKAKRP